MLRRLHKDKPSDYSACVFDAKGKTFRDDIYPAYKANRPPMPDDLGCADRPAARMHPRHGLAAARGRGRGGRRRHRHSGRARRKPQGVRTLISSGDKDLTQLVDPLVTMVNTMSNETFDEAGVAAKFGVRPEPDRRLPHADRRQRGQHSRGGQGRSQDRGQVAAAVRHARSDRWRMPTRSAASVGENLRKARDWLPTARELLTVKRDLAASHRRWRTSHTPSPTSRAWHSCSSTSTSRAGDASSARCSCRSAPRPEREYETILTAAQLEAWLARIAAAELTCVDTETTSLDPQAAQLVGISLSVEPHRAAYLPLAHRYAGAPEQLPFDATLARLKPWLEDPARAKVGQNVKYDMHVLANHGIALRGARHDTLLQSYVLESHRPHDMDSLAQRHLGVKTIGYEEVAGKGAAQIAFEQVSVEQATEYSAEDADITLQLHRALYPLISADQKLAFIYDQIEMPVMQVLFDVERRRRAARRRPAEPAEPGAGPAHAGHRATRQGGCRPAVQPQLAEADPGGAVREEPAAGAEEDAERTAVHRRGRPRGAGAGLSARPPDSRLPHAVQAQVHLHRQAAAHGEPAHRTRAHQLRAGGGGDGAAVQQRAEPAEHPDPQRRGPAHPRGLHRAARSSHPLGRLLAGRAAHHGAPVGGREPDGRVPVRRGRAPPHRRRDLRHPRQRGHQRAAPLRQDHQLRSDLRHVRLRPGRAAGYRAQRRPAVHGALLPALPEGQGVHGPDAQERARARATWRPCSAGACT